MLRDLAGPAAKEFGEYLGRRVHIYGVVRTVKAAQKARAQIQASGLEQQPIPLKFLVPALEGAALEEDEDLATRWAGLLATAATSGQVLPAYADILRQLTPEEARMLDFIYDQSRPVLDEAEGVDKKALQESSGLSQREFLIRIQNLHRLELVVQLTSAGWSRSEDFGAGATSVALGSRHWVKRSLSRAVVQVSWYRRATTPHKPLKLTAASFCRASSRARHESCWITRRRILAAIRWAA